MLYNIWHLQIPDDQHNIEVRVAVMGSADAGKSTLLGVLTQGQLDNGRAVSYTHLDVYKRQVLLLGEKR